MTDRKRPRNPDKRAQANDERYDDERYDGLGEFAQDETELGNDADVIETATVKKSVAVGNISYSMMSDGNMVVVERRRLYGPTSFESKGDSIADRTLKVTTTIDGIPLPVGVVVIFGGTNSAKSPLASYLVKQGKGKLLRYGEPLPGYSRDLTVLLQRVFAAEESLIAIDSMKNLVGRIDGGLMKTGLSREFFAMMSDWSSYFSELGQTILVIVNANVDPRQPELVNTVIEGLWSNTNGVIHSEGGILKWTMRVGDAMPRIEGQAKIAWSTNRHEGIARLAQFGESRQVGSFQSRQESNSQDVTPVGETETPIETISPLNRGVSRIINRTARGSN